MPMPTKELQREYQRLWIARRRAAYFKDKSCVDCGSKESLQLDHIDRTTKVDHRIWSWSEERRSEELEKCTVRCQPCHQIKTNNDLDRGYTVHGSEIRGYHHGCRCEACTEAHRLYNKAIRDKLGHNMSRAGTPRKSRGIGRADKASAF